jgi:MoaA/NifB/PqqE/SkfB family radical SAM enzyme
MSSKITISRTENALKGLNERLSASAGMTVSNETFCALPFLHLSTTTNGEIRLCCRSRPIASIREQSLVQAWEGPVLDQVRRDLVNGVRRPECRSCWELEDLGMVSLRNGQNIRWREIAEPVRAWAAGETPKIRFVELKLSNRCNLKCRMCSPISSTPWLREWPTVRTYYSEGDREAIDEAYDYQISHQAQTLDFFSSNPAFLSDMEQISPHLDELEFAGGEPLIDPLHYAVLDLLKERAPGISLKYSTNLTKLGTAKFDVLEYWSRFKHVSVTVSVDGFPELNEYIRTGTVSSEFEENLRRLQQLPNVSLKSSVCVSVYNAFYLHETFSYVASLGLPLYNNRVKAPHFLDARVLPSGLRREAVAKLRDFKLPDDLLVGDQVQRERSQRTIDDCIAWLEDDRLASLQQLTSFVNFARDLDEKRKTTYIGFRDWLPRAHYE